MLKRYVLSTGNVPFTLQSREMLHRQFTQVVEEKLRLGKRILALTVYWWVTSDALRSNPLSEHSMVNQPAGFGAQT